MAVNQDEEPLSALKGRASGGSRSPNYPQMNITQAIDRIKKVYAEEHTHSVPDQSIAVALGYSSLNGTSKVVLSSLKKFGLLVPSGDGFKVSQDAVAILELPADDSTRIVAIHKSALRPPVFKQLYEKYGTDLPSDASLRHYLVSTGFESDAANQVIRHYKDTLGFMASQSADKQTLGKKDQAEVSSETTAPKQSVEQSSVNPFGGIPTPPASVQTAAHASQLRFQVSSDSYAEISFTSEITQAAITKLISYLKLSMDLYPVRANGPDQHSSKPSSASEEHDIDEDDLILEGLED